MPIVKYRYYRGKQFELGTLILEKLKKKKYTTTELAHEFKICQKTVQRYLSIIEVYYPLQRRCLSNGHNRGTCYEFWIGYIED